MKLTSLTAAAAALCVAVLSAAALPLGAEPVPAQLAGTWKITRVLPSAAGACWSGSQARPLVGSNLTYSAGAMRWRGGSVPLGDIITRTVTAQEFRRENNTLGTPPDFAALGIHAARVTEIDLQHEDADITGATTEVPGDAVLLAAPNRIVVSACGVYFEATRSSSASLLHTASMRR